MDDTAEAIARDLIAEIGRANALLHLAGELTAVRSWREVKQVGRLMWAASRT